MDLAIATHVSCRASSGPDFRTNRISQGDLPDNTKLTAWIHESKFMVEAFGTGYSVAEVGEMFAWLGAALRSSPYNLGVACCTPSINVNSTLDNVSRTLSSHRIFCVIDFTIQECEERFEPSNGQCWHKIFRNPVVVQGYPISSRSESSTGLEIPLDIMAGLTQIRRINTFNGKLFIKGFSIMLVPTKHSGDLLMWHLLHNENGSRMSYLDKTVANVGDANAFDLENTRHIVGWCSEMKYYTGRNHTRMIERPLLLTLSVPGAADASYTVETSRLPRPREGCILEKVSIRAGSIIRGDSRFALGHKDTSIHILRQNDYISKLEWISKKFVVLWDEEDKRGWLVNGISALLHVLRTSLESDIAGEFKSVMLFQRGEMEEASESHTAGSAISVLLKAKNRELKIYPTKNGYLRLEDRVEHFYDILEKIIDHQVNVTEQHSIGLRENLEGWDFMHLATRQDIIYPRVAALHALGKGWVDFTRAIHAITLVGRGFGEIIQPASPNLCPYWAKLPKGRYYLAAGVSDLKKIMNADGDHKANPIKINDNIIWHNPDMIFEHCQCTRMGRGKHSDFAQVLLPSKFGHLVPKRDPVRLEDHGAVIFGHNIDFKWFWKDTGDPEQGEPPSLSEEFEMQSHDSGIGSSVNFSAGKGSRDLMGLGSQELSNGCLSGGTFTFKHYTVGIVCALEKELLAVRILFDRRHDRLPDIPSRDTNHYALGCIGRYNVVAACLPAGEYGTNSAADVVSQMKTMFPAVEFCLLVGIGGGVPSELNDIRLGDVVVSLPSDTYSGVIQYDLGKTVSRSQFQLTGSLQRPPRSLLTTISDLRSDPDLSSEPLSEYIEHIIARKPTYNHPGRKHDTLFEADHRHKPTPTRDTCEQCNSEKEIQRQCRSTNHPSIHYGLIASGNQVMRDAQVRNSLGNKYKILCFEMEAAGVMNTIPCLVIRGICDYADTHKNEVWQEYASATAAAYAKLLLSFA
jgi:nucleoside phosphorylase